MFECKVCGLLSLGGTACPACGSQLLVDLAHDDGDSSPLPTEVPGLDDAVASWYELEGIEPPVEAAEPVQTQSAGNLPFGYSGESNTHISRLPFGVGSYASGMPFEDSEDALPLVSETQVDASHLTQESIPIVQLPPQPVVSPTPTPLKVVEAPMETIPVPSEPLPIASKVVESTPILPQVMPLEPLPIVLPSPSVEELPPAPIEDAPIRVAPVHSTAAPQPASTVHEISSDSQSSFVDVPEMWRIDASPVDMDQIYSVEEQIVEVVHTMDDSESTYMHATDVEDLHPESGIISLELHPAKAMGVNLSGLPELEETLAEGFLAIGEESWAKAAIAFQKMAAKMPGDSAVFNNYGLALLQRALVMAKSSDLEVQQLASTQFESAILALREAAKSAPTDGTILLNLCHALLVSGRAEKALKVLFMYQKNNENTSESANLEAASLVSMGESSNALKVLQAVQHDELVLANIAKLSYS